MPALSDNYPYTLLECIQYGIPFVTSCVGGIPEILSDELSRRHLCFEPTPRDLSRCLNDYLRAAPDERRAPRPRPRDSSATAGYCRRSATGRGQITPARPRYFSAGPYP